MRNVVLGLAAVSLALGATGAAVGAPRAKTAEVALSIVDAEGRSLELGALPQAERQRVVSLRNNLQQWGNQQGERLVITIRCTRPPFRCEIEVKW
jgi:TolA-binding protein